MAMENQRIIIAGIVGGSIAAIFYSIPFLNFVNCFCCIGIMTGGVVALYYFDRSLDSREYLSPAIAITLGIASGIIGAFISLVIEWFVYQNFGHWELELLQDMMNNMEEVPTYIEELMVEIESELQKGFNWGAILFRNLILMPVFCLIGSLIMRVLLNKNRVFEI
jgi:hypothetical protein